MFKNLVLLGAPGSGKGTQSAKLKEMGYKHVSTGDLLRAEIAKASDLGKKVKKVLDSGELVSDELVFDLLKVNVQVDINAYVFDGFPRTLKQAEMLHNQILGKLPYKVISLKIDTEKLVKRLANRWVTPDGKHIYNLLSNAPKKAGICDVTGQALIQREDDKEEVVRKRMLVFDSMINPILEYYKKLGLLLEIEADNDVEWIFGQIKKQS